MKITDIDSDDYKFKVSMCDLENLFNIHKDKKNNYIYNLNETFYLNVNKEDCDIFVTQHDMYWPLISYKIYGTTKMAWLLQKINNIENPMEIIHSGTNIYFIDKTFLSNIFQEINNV